MFATKRGSIFASEREAFEVASLLAQQRRELYDDFANCQMANGVPLNVDVTDDNDSSFASYVMCLASVIASLNAR
jgi:hypothetical protein